jgi:hypothetical protein
MAFSFRTTHALRFCILITWMLASAAGAAESRNLAPGFAALAKGTSLLVMQPDVELFSISGGGVVEPKADWTEQAHKYIHDALDKKTAALGLQTRSISEQDGDAFAEISALHAAVARSINLHHMSGGNLALPTKNGKLDWSLGDAVRPIREKSGADYALFIWLRDSYASAERKVAILAMALLGVGMPGGMQTGYASLVDLQTGRVLWFNRLLRGTGDLREADTADETVSALLAQFPGTQ